MRCDYSEAKTNFHVWQYSSIGPGKKFDVPTEPDAPRLEEKVKFYDGLQKFGFVSEKRKNLASLSDYLPFTEEACVLTFLSFAKLQRHLDFGHHHYDEKNPMQLARVSDKWVKRLERTIEQRSSSHNNTANGEHSKSNLLQMGWGIPERAQAIEQDTNSIFEPIVKNSKFRKQNYSRKS